MKLRNKKTGEIKAFDEVMREAYKWNNYDSLAELNEEWEDYEEPKEHFTPALIDNDIVAVILDKKMTRKEAEKTVEKLTAWTQLRSKGFKFFNNKIIGEYGNVSYRLTYPATTIEEKQLDLLFGGEE